MKKAVASKKSTGVIGDTGKTVSSQKKPGRPSSFSQAVADEICTRISNGESIRAICASQDMPTCRMFFAWLHDNEELRKQYARARDEQSDTYAAMVVDEAFSASDAQIGRLRVDALKWAASKLAPKKYGDKLEVEQTGEQKIKIVIGGADGA